MQKKNPNLILVSNSIIRSIDRNGLSFEFFCIKLGLENCRYVFGNNQFRMGGKDAVNLL